VLNGHYTAVFISTAIHITLLIALIYLSTDIKIPVEKPISEPAIKSYIYKPPVQPLLKVIEANEKKEETMGVTEKPKTAKPITSAQKLTEKKIEKAAEQSDENNIILETTKNKVKPDKEEEKKAQALSPSPSLPVLPSLAIKPQKPVSAGFQKRFSAQEQLSRLRRSINSNVIKGAYKQHTQARSVSDMDGAPIPVPHSVKKLTAEQRYKSNTSTTGHNKITKHDNGTCTIHREQMLGSPIEATTSGFACGESKFDKNFRQHMKKVRDKVMPQRR